MKFSRYLKYQFPLMRGTDVLLLQRRLQELGYRMVGTPDGIFGAGTERAVRAFQTDRRLTVDGIVGQQTWNDMFEAERPGGHPQDSNIIAFIPLLKDFHGYRDSVRWRLQKKGLEIEGSGIERTGGEPKTVKRVWDQFSYAIDQWSERYGVPAELIVATICTESSGNPRTVREEPGYKSDHKTPEKVSPGLMQTLISTARYVLKDPTIDREWLLNPGNSIQAGTAYIASQMKRTNLDPPKVACAYNAGGVYYNDGRKNRWKMRQYPIGTSEHADRFVKWFNDFYAVMEAGDADPKLSFLQFL
jgi:hypothetical protein